MKELIPKQKGQNSTLRSVLDLFSLTMIACVYPPVPFHRPSHLSSGVCVCVRTCVYNHCYQPGSTMHVLFCACICVHCSYIPYRHVIQFLNL